ncbi:MAG TPA: RtcB family protein [bacterium]|nr:RtcB family protein [bacterium]HOL47060.1 RtcB family protein [bacterium]HPQ17935.1 RtcB family protein [bacterium]
MKHQISFKEKRKNCYSLEFENKEIEVLVYLSEKLLKEFGEEESLIQLINASKLKGVISPVIGMPDIHTGFGLPIGGVLATDYNNGIVSAGAVGYDINCGVRVLNTKIHSSNLDKEKLRKILLEITKRVPLGVGKESPYKELRKIDIEGIAYSGVKYVINMGFGREADLEKIESNGNIICDNVNVLNKEEIERADQLGTLGGGNHFIEIGKIEKVYDKYIADRLGLAEDYIYILIHTGSRGFGHQIATDYSKIMWNNSEKNKTPAPVKGLACAPIHSKDGEDYLNAMAIAANYAFANREIITHLVREAFVKVFKDSEEKIGLNLVYDVAHNIAKKEMYNNRMMLIHRKGATRALPAGNKEIPAIYRDIGQPAIIPGSMGTASYIVIGTEQIKETFNSVNHGAGRTMSRTQAFKNLTTDDLLKQTKDIVLIADNLKKIIDEAPSAYKNIDEVVWTLVDAGLTKPIVRFIPMAVLKGEE